MYPIERPTGPDPREEDRCPECGEHSFGDKVCERCRREAEADEDNG